MTSLRGKVVFRFSVRSLLSAQFAVAGYAYPNTRQSAMQKCGRRSVSYRCKGPPCGPKGFLDNVKRRIAPADIAPDEAVKRVFVTPHQ